MDAKSALKAKLEKIEELREELHELETSVIGAETKHNGKDAILFEVDWNNRHALLNYDDKYYEWIEF